MQGDDAGFRGVFEKFKNVPFKVRRKDPAAAEDAWAISNPLANQRISLSPSSSSDHPGRPASAGRNGRHDIEASEPLNGRRRSPAIRLRPFPPRNALHDPLIPVSEGGVSRENLGPSVGEILLAPPPAARAPAPPRRAHHQNGPQAGSRDGSSSSRATRRNDPNSSCSDDDPAPRRPHWKEALRQVQFSAGGAAGNSHSDDGGSRNDGVVSYGKGASTSGCALPDEHPVRTASQCFSEVSDISFCDPDLEDEEEEIEQEDISLWKVPPMDVMKLSDDKADGSCGVRRGD